MSNSLIGLHLKAPDAAAARRQTIALMEARGFALLDDQPLRVVIEEEDQPPQSDDWYGMAMSGVAGTGWVSLYVPDWPDSGVLAQELSRRLDAPAIELWLDNDEHWGYTFFEAGHVRDRFADAPGMIAETDAEAASYAGRPAALGPILQTPVAEAEAVLQHARASAGQFAGAAMEAFTRVIGLPFGHAYIGYDQLLDGDPEDCADDLEGWPAFRHLAFALPPGREGLSE